MIIKNDDEYDYHSSNSTLSSENLVTNQIFKEKDFKYMHIINNIKDNHLLENEDYINSCPCYITKNTSNVYFMTKEKYVNVGFHKNFIHFKKLNKFLQNIKIYNDTLNDLYKIRSEMHFIINALYDYLMYMNLSKNYFTFFQKIVTVHNFYDLIKIHESFVQHIFKLSFLSKTDLSFIKIIFNIINTVNIFKYIMKSIIPLGGNIKQLNVSKTCNINTYDEHTLLNYEECKQHDYYKSFLFLFEQNFKILEHNIILLTSQRTQDFIKQFYINRNHFIQYVNKFKNSDLSYIYQKFFFNEYYAHLCDESYDTP